MKNTTFDEFFRCMAYLGFNCTWNSVLMMFQPLVQTVSHFLKIYFVLGWPFSVITKEKSSNFIKKNRKVGYQKRETTSDYDLKKRLLANIHLLKNATIIIFLFRFASFTKIKKNSYVHILVRVNMNKTFY